MLRQLSKYTTSSIKYAANNTAAILISLSASSKDDPSLPSPQLLSYWITETQKGLEAFFNDEFELAQKIFMQHHKESPFHAVGYALMAYVEAILGFESEKISIALEKIEIAEALARQFSKKAKRKSEDDNVQYELIALNCMLMSSTIQFLRNNWLEYMKAAYKLRKAYKLYEQMFESITGLKTAEYASNLKKSNIHLSTQLKRKSLFQLPKRSSFEPISFKKRPISTIDSYNLVSSSDLSIATIDNAIESGIFFGTGLFSLIFSLLPPKVNKLLNTLGFHSSRPFALHLLKKSFQSHSLYSCLSALTLLAYYTNLSLFIHPHLLPNSLHLDTAREILDQMKLVFPRGKIWKLLDGKLCKMEGKTERGVEILKDARYKKNHICELVQLQALSVYEMGWGQIFLGQYFQAAETFFRLESMNNWSRAFYHYIATSCIFAAEEYDKAAIEFMQIPNILRRKRLLGGRLLPNELFAERKIRYWKSKRVGDGHTLKNIVIVNPLWELIYLWNGFSQLKPQILQTIKQTIETTLATVSDVEIGTDLSLLYLLLGVSVRELGDLDLADMYLRQSFKYHDQAEDRWVIPHTSYEMATLSCFRLVQTTDLQQRKHLYTDAHEWIQKSERHLAHKINNTKQQHDPLTSDHSGDSDWDSRLHVRCQLLIEKLEDFHA